MKKIIFSLYAVLLVLGISFNISAETKNKPFIIAHRGSCGYLPEHTLEAKVMAYAQGAEYIEQDVCLTKDDKVVILHDPFLDTVTNVKEMYPERHDKNNRYPARLFTLAEIKKLTVHERTHENDTDKAVFSNRFPLKTDIDFKVPTLQEEIQLIQGLNKSTGKNIGICVELKNPWYYKDHGNQFAKIVLDILAEYGYKTSDSKCIIQCFDPYLLKHMKNELKSELKLLQLILPNTWVGDQDWAPDVKSYDALLTKESLEEIAKYSYAIGPFWGQLFTNGGDNSDLVLNDVANLAHEQGLEIYPYTLRADSLPEGTTFTKICDLLFKDAKIEGLFTDHPDVGVEYINKNFK